MYTLSPKDFILSRLFTPDARRPMLNTFTATVFRGHLERGGQQIGQLAAATSILPPKFLTVDSQQTNLVRPPSHDLSSRGVN